MQSVGIDINGHTLRIAIEDSESGEARVLSHRLAFLEIPETTTNALLLRKFQSSYIRHAGKLYITGEDAVNLSIIFGRELLHPIQPASLKYPEMVQAVVGQLLGKLGVGKDTRAIVACPAEPVDASFSADYRRHWLLNKVLAPFFREVEFVDVAHALAFYELMDDDVTGLTLDVGEETVNLTLSYLSIPALSISLPYGASSIDAAVAKTSGLLSQEVERVRRAEGSEPDSFAYHSGNFISKLLADLRQHIQHSGATLNLDKPIKAVIAGDGLRSLDSERLASELVQLPLDIGNVRVVQGNECALSVCIGSLLIATGDSQEDAPSTQPFVKEGDNEAQQGHKGAENAE